MEQQTQIVHKCPLCEEMVNCQEMDAHLDAIDYHEAWCAGVPDDVMHPFDDDEDDDEDDEQDEV